MDSDGKMKITEFLNTKTKKKRARAVTKETSEYAGGYFSATQYSSYLEWDKMIAARRSVKKEQKFYTIEEENVGES